MTGGAQPRPPGCCAPPGSGRRCRRLLDRLDDFRSAQEIHEELRRTGEGIGLTTVYRTLQTLADGGEVDVLRTGTGEAVYRRCATADHHHHLVCRRCGRTVEIEGPDVESWARGWPRRTGSPSSATPPRSSGCAGCAPARGDPASVSDRHIRWPMAAASVRLPTRGGGRGRRGEHQRGNGRGAEHVRRLDGAEAAELAGLAAVFEDLQYVLRCCEHLVTALNSPETGPVRVDTDTALVEALWSGRADRLRPLLLRPGGGALRRRPGRAGLDGDVGEFHSMVKKLRDHYASRHVNPRESFTIGAAQANDGRPTGVAVISTPRPIVDDTTVRLLGRVAYALSGLVDARMQAAQNRVLGAAGQLTPMELSRLPLVHLSAEA